MAEEACEEIGYAKNIEEFSNENYITKEEYDKLYENDKKELKPFINYYEMSTKKVQRFVNGKGTRTAEGIYKPVPVQYPVAK